METQIPPTLDSSQLAVIQRKLYLDSRIRNGANWFFWIAGLSIINTLTFLFGINFNFVIGLAVTQIIDGFTFVLAKELGKGWGIVPLIGFAMDLGIAGIFVVFGILGKKRYSWAIIVGMILYVVDGIIMLLFKEFFSAGFHAFALVSIGSSLKAISELTNLEKIGGTESIESIKQQMPTLQQPEVTPQRTRIRWILAGLIFLAVFSCIVIFALQQ